MDPELKMPHERIRREQSTSVGELLNVYASADIVVATRYHGTVLGLRSGRPVLGVCYYRKTQEVLAGMGQAAYAVDIDEIDQKDLWQKFQRLVIKRHEEEETIRYHGDLVTARLAEQYDTVLKILKAPMAP